MQNDIDKIYCLLNEENDTAMLRTSMLFDSYCTHKDIPILLYGAGNIGKKVAQVLVNDNYTNIFFVDIDKNKWKTTINNILVLSLDEAIMEYAKNGVFVVTVFNREDFSDFRQIHKKITSQGANCVLPFPILAWKYADKLLPHFMQGTPKEILQNKNEIIDAVKLFNDDISIRTYREMLEVSLTANFLDFADNYHEATYFLPEVINNLPEKIIFADCGAYDGDTLKSFLKYIDHSKLEEYHAFEADTKNYQELLSFVDSLNPEIKQKIFCHNLAISKENGRLAFSSEGTEASKISEAGEIIVDCISLDNFFANKRCDFIKMDIEGAEQDALLGAKDIIYRDNPIMTISVYHCPNDFYKIPNYIMALNMQKERKKERKKERERVRLEDICPTFMKQYFTTYKLVRYNSYFFDTILIINNKEVNLNA